MHIAIAGGTGMLGAPVVEVFLAKGHRVSVISRSQKSVEERFAGLVQALVADPARSDLSGLLKGVDGLHISLAGSGKPKDYYSQSHAVERLLAEGKRAGIGYVSYLSGATVGHPSAKDFYDNHAKLLAEGHIRASGIPYRIFRPSWFLETLPLFIQGDKMSLLGKVDHPQAWLTVQDFAPLVVAAHQDRPGPSTQWVGGPEERGLTQAFQDYANKKGMNTMVLSPGMARFLALLGGGSKLRHAADLMEYFTKVPDQPQGSDGAIRTPTGISAWLASK